MLPELIVCAHYDLTVDIRKQTCSTGQNMYVCCPQGGEKSGNNDKLF